MNARIIQRASRRVKSPIYVPPEGLSSLRILAESGFEAFRSEVERLFHLGSPWAAALLGHLHLTTEAGGAPKAIEVCRAAANGGSAYAQYVLAWALAYAEDNQKQALHYLRLASLQNFTPATVDLAQFVFRGMGTTAPGPRAAVRILRIAIKRGHRGAPARILYIYRKKGPGLARKILGYVLAPIAAVWYLASIYANPFDENVYLLVRRLGHPFVPSKGKG